MKAGNAPTASCWQDPWLWALALWGASVSLLAFPPAGLWPLAVVGPAPLWASCVLSPAGVRRSLLRGWFYGLGFFGTLVWWIVPTVTRYGGLPLSAGAACLVLLAAYLSLYPAVACVLVALASRGRSPWGLALAPLLWTALEGVRGALFSGFPWGDLPQALWRVPWALGLAPWVGIDGVRLLLASAGAALAWALAQSVRASLGPVRRSWPGLLPLALCGPAAALLLVLPAPLAPKAGELRVSVVQGNIDQAQKWDLAFRTTTLQIYRGLTRRVARGGQELIIWPETAVPYYVQESSAGRAAVEALARETGAHLLFGAPAYVIGARGMEGRNAVFVASPAGEIVARYDKVHLVPFGEYMPLGWLFPFATKLVQGVGDFTSGPGVVPLPALDGIPRLGPLVCFEMIFPDLSATHAARGAQLLTVVTNDGWFGSTPGPSQHLAFGAWRAAETGLPLIRAANTGISAAFDERGSLLRWTRLLEPAAFSLRISYPAPHRTPATGVRPWISPASGLLALPGLFAIVVRFGRRERRGRDIDKGKS
ncbi:MAG: apolipoprotein N-acyltransferase [Deltaproteobacteria bacterium]|nr:apolipoprotein N-acyltransferase [Deltaproteobacteria bacterium]